MTLEHGYKLRLRNDGRELREATAESTMETISL